MKWFSGQNYLSSVQAVSGYQPLKEKKNTAFLSNLEICPSLMQVDRFSAT